MHHLGLDGYDRLATVVRDATRRFQAGIADAGLRLTHEPDLSIMEFTHDTAPVGAIGDVMDDKGWHLDRQPGGLHLMLSPYHAEIADRFLEDLAWAVQNAGDDRGKAAGYAGGGVAPASRQRRTDPFGIRADQLDVEHERPYGPVVVLVSGAIGAFALRPEYFARNFATWSASSPTRMFSGMIAPENPPLRMA